MSLIINQVFVDEKFAKCLLVRQFDGVLVPSIGMEIEDLAWEKPKKIKKIVLNPEQDSYILFVEDEFISKRDLSKITEKYKKCGWIIAENYN
ncbi:MAG TPA: hypothetical protein PLL66_01580 [Bacteroidales bacterium]|nr:hypothetical protein [Bacteroidales bacterium]